MFGFKPKEEDKKLSDVNNRLLDEMITYGPDSEEYAKHLAFLERIHLLRKATERKRLDVNNIALVGGNLLGILVIVAYEQRHVFTSRAQNFILKSK